MHCPGITPYDLLTQLGQSLAKSSKCSKQCSIFTRPLFPASALPEADTVPIEPTTCGASLKDEITQGINSRDPQVSTCVRFDGSARSAQTTVDCLQISVNTSAGHVGFGVMLLWSHRPDWWPAYGPLRTLLQGEQRGITSGIYIQMHREGSVCVIY